AAQRHALVKQHVVADLGGFRIYHAQTVVDEETPANGGSGVDFDAREKTADLRNDTRNQRYTPLIEPMRQAVQQNGMKPWVTEEDFDYALGRGILAEDGVELFPNSPKHGSSS